MNESITAESETAPPAVSPITPELIDIDYFSKIDLRVAEIISAEALPKSKKLLKLQVSLGAHGNRQILSGIAKFYTPESLIGRKIIIIANLQPAKLAGEDSQGMLLAASPEDDSVISLLQPNCEIPSGSRVR